MFNGLTNVLSTKRAYSESTERLVMLHLAKVTTIENLKIALETEAQTLPFPLILPDSHRRILEIVLSLLRQLNNTLSKNSEGKYVTTQSQRKLLEQLYSGSIESDSFIALGTKLLEPRFVQLLSAVNIAEHNRYIEYGNNLINQQNFSVLVLTAMSISLGVSSIVIILKGMVVVPATILFPYLLMGLAATIFVLITYLGPRYCQSLGQGYLDMNVENQDDIKTLGELMAKLNVAEASMFNDVYQQSSDLTGLSQLDV